MKENIFSNFYTKVLNFFTSRNEEDSARSTASNRLKLVLMQDRSNLDGATMQKMREQLISVISKYIEIRRLGENNSSIAETVGKRQKQLYPVGFYGQCNEVHL